MVVKRCVCAYGISLRHIRGKNVKIAKRICCRFLRYLDGIVLFFFQKKNVEKEKLTNLSEKAVKIEMFFFPHCMRCGRQVEDKNKIMRPRHATL